MTGLNLTLLIGSISRAQAHFGPMRSPKHLVTRASGSPELVGFFPSLHTQTSPLGIRHPGPQGPFHCIIHPAQARSARRLRPGNHKVIYWSGRLSAPVHGRPSNCRAASVSVLYDETSPQTPNVRLRVFHNARGRVRPGLGATPSATRPVTEESPFLSPVQPPQGALRQERPLWTVFARREAMCLSPARRADPPAPEDDHGRRCVPHLEPGADPCLCQKGHCRPCGAICHGITVTCPSSVRSTSTPEGAGPWNTKDSGGGSREWGVGATGIDEPVLQRDSLIQGHRGGTASAPGIERSTADRLHRTKTCSLSSTHQSLGHLNPQCHHPSTPWVYCLLRHYHTCPQASTPRNRLP